MRLFMEFGDLPRGKNSGKHENALSDVAKGVELAPEQLAEREYIKERDRQRGLEEEEEKESDMDRLARTENVSFAAARLDGDDHSPSNRPLPFMAKKRLTTRDNSWMAPPAGLASVGPLDMDDHKCFVPKKCVHRFTGHNKGVHRIRLFPNTGHLLLSAGLDGKCKVWSIEKKQGHAYLCRSLGSGARRAVQPGRHQVCVGVL